MWALIQLKEMVEKLEQKEAASAVAVEEPQEQSASAAVEEPAPAVAEAVPQQRNPQPHPEPQPSEPLPGRVVTLEELLDEVRRAVEEADRAPVLGVPLLSLDLECTDFSTAGGQIRTVQVAWFEQSENHAVVAEIPLSWSKGKRFRWFYEFTSLLSSFAVAGHNLTFDFRHLYKEVETWDWLPKYVVDTLTFQRFLEASRGRRKWDWQGKGYWTLQQVVRRELGVELDKSLQPPENWRVPELSELHYRYALLDALVELRLARHQLEQLKQLGWSDQAVKLLAGFCSEHCRLDWALRRFYRPNSRYQRVLEELRRKERELKEAFEAKYGFSPSSHKAVIEELREMDVEVDSFNKPAKLRLVLLAKEGKIPAEAGELVQAVQNWDAVKKRADLLQGFLNADMEKAYIVPGSAPSGRYALSNPNFLQVPREWKQDLLIPPRGCVLVRADFPSQEGRICCVVANERKWIETLRNGGDLHRQTAGFLLGKAPDEVTKEERAIGKTCNFGLLYGASPSTLQRELIKVGIVASREEAKRYHTAFFKAYQALAAWHRDVKSRFRQQGFFVVTTLGGRKIKVLPPPEAAFRKKDVEKWKQEGTWEEKQLEKGIREALNLHGQAVGWDISATAMVLFQQVLRKRGWLDFVFPLLLVHDELVVLAREELAEEVVELLTQVMEQAMDRLLPPLAGCNQVPLEDVVVVFSSGEVKTAEEILQTASQQFQQEDGDAA